MGFRAISTQIKSETIGWKAKCTSGKLLSRGTRQGSTRVALRHGAWSSHGTYTAKLPYKPGMVGHFTVLTDQGHFTSRTTATGTFHLVVALLVHGKKIDRCDTGRVTWRARHQ